MGLPPRKRTVSFGIRRAALSCCPGLLLLAASNDVAPQVCGTGVMMSKVACVVLILAIPGLLGYPAALNVDRREKSSRQLLENSATGDIWPVPPAAATLVSLQPRWLMVQMQAVQGRTLGGGFLTKELQRELARVGCYNGEINGVWTQSTRRAMQSFTNRVNALLPTERPDHILLAIVRSYPDKTCKKPCPTGETSAPDGRCVPGAIAGLATKTAALSHAKPVPRVTRWSATEITAADDYAAPVDKPPRARLTAPAKPPPPPKMVAAPPPKQVPQRLKVQRTEREQSRTAQHSEFVRTFFQRLDGSGR